MKRTKLLALVAVASAMAAAQTARAGIDFGASATLAQLYADPGNYLTVDDKVFSGFIYQDTGLTTFDASQIIVTASASGGIDYLTWSGNISYGSSSGVFSSADLKLNYKVLATVEAINMIDQAYTGSAHGSGYLTVDETAAIGAYGGTPVGWSHLDPLDISDPPAENNDNLNIVPPQTLLYVTKDIGFFVNGPGFGVDTISQVSQSFHQGEVPEPTTLIAGAMLLLPFGASTLRILRKNRTS